MELTDSDATTMVRLEVAGINLAAELNVGDTVHILGIPRTSPRPFDSIQIEQETVESAKTGQSIGVKNEGPGVRCGRRI